MPIRTKFPKGTSLFRRVVYPLIRNFFFFFFTYVAYYPIRRVNKPKLKGPYIWACSHSNFLCDAVPAGYEGDRPTKFLAKSTLFRFPIKSFIEFCGALPVARMEDLRQQAPGARSSQNRATFRAAIAAMKEGWPIAIYPEGVSIVSPGLVLPLKVGVAKLAFAAEDAADFSLGVKIIPVGLEYGNRIKVASGITIRYGKPIEIQSYRKLYEEDDAAVVRAVMKELTQQMVSCFPHFKDEKTQTLGRKIVALGLAPSKHAIAQIFLQKEEDQKFWHGLEEKMRAFEEEAKGQHIPIPAWGLRKSWKDLGPTGRMRSRLWLALGLPLAIFDLLNNSIPEVAMQSIVGYIAVDETEKMSLRFMISPVVLPTMYALQFWLAQKVLGEFHIVQLPLWSYFLYAAGSFVTWYFAIHWRRHFKRMISLAFFRYAGVNERSEVVAHYRRLRQHLSDL